MQNIVVLFGNVGQDPETRTTQGRASVTHFTLATLRPFCSEGRVFARFVGSCTTFPSFWVERRFSFPLKLATKTSRQ
ncbi:single-stranded DNA-binding protein [Labrenzia sp. EL_13]|nr:single-stranded DNA-binding protein [Labrenzia sp. EL_13]